MPTLRAQLIGLDPGCRLIRYSISDIRGWSGYHLAFATEFSVREFDAVGIIPREIGTSRDSSYESDSEGNERYIPAVPDSSFLGNDRLHTDSLPDGITHYGVYYAAVWSADEVYVIENLAYSCPHCAYHRALYLLQAAGVNGANGPLPTVWWRGPDNTDTAEIRPIVVNHGTTKIEFTELGCNNCGRPGHNSRTCAVTQRFYDRIGVEIEGRFFNIREVMRIVESNGLNHCGDGSIRRGQNSDCTPLEIQTSPDHLAGTLRQVAKFYPDEVDYSCGMHVHVSFKDTCNIGLLATEEFVRYFTQRWEEWGARMSLAQDSEFFKRLRGENEYCCKNSSYDLERLYRADRYRQLNFTSWNEHKTVECRLLPMFKEARLALSAITELVNIYEDWLAGAALIMLPKVEYTEVTSIAAYEHKFSDIGEIDVITSVSQFYRTTELEVTELQPVSSGYTRIALSEGGLETLRQLISQITERSAA